MMPVQKGVVRALGICISDQLITGLEAVRYCMDTFDICIWVTAYFELEASIALVSVPLYVICHI